MLTFIIASFAIIASPGPSVIYLMTTSLTSGRKAGFRIIPGIFLGDLTAMTISFLGIGILLSHFPMLSNLIKIIGSLYLIWLGIQAFLIKEKTENARENGFLQGILIEITNPKTLIFFATFFPQFIGKAGNIWILGTIFLLIGLLSDTIYVTFSGFIGKFLSEKTAANFSKIGGIIMILTAIDILI